MSSTTEQRVVQMQFDNAQFEAGVQQTLLSLNKLNDSIEKNTKTNAGLSFRGLENALGSADSKLSSISRSAANLKNAFSVAGVASQRVVNNITDSLYRMGVNCAKTLTGINSMSDGFDKFGQKTKAVSTLMTTTGASFKDVQKAVDDLAWFSDQTSYNFTDMIDSMAKLTASGDKNLSHLTTTVKGFALAGARAGVGAREVSAGMYQLTQAASRGYLMYQDWAQALGTRNIASAQLKQQMIEAAGKTAIAAGANKDFNDSLKKGWLTMDVFRKVMGEYTAGINKANWSEEEYAFKNDKATNSTTEFSKAAFQAAQECRTWSDVVDAVKDAISSGWSTSYEMIFGNVNEVRKLWTGICNFAIEISDKFTSARNNLLEEWRNAGGRDALIKSFLNVINGIHRVIEPIKEAFEEVFGTLTGDKLAGATNSLEGFTKKLELTREQMIHVKEVFLTVFGTIKNVFDALRPYAKQIISFLTIITVLKSVQSIMAGGLGFGSLASILKIIIGIGILKHFMNFNSTASKTSGIIKGIVTVIQTLGTKLTSLVSKISSSKIFQVISTGLKLVAAIAVWAIKEIINGVQFLVSKIQASNIISILTTKLSEFKNFVVSIINAVAEKITGLKGIRLNSFANLLTFVEAIGKKIFGVITLIGKGITDIFKFKSPFNTVLDLLKTGKESLEETNKNIKDTRTNIQGISGDFNAMSASVIGAGNATSSIGHNINTFFKNLGTTINNFKDSDSPLAKVFNTITHIDWQRALAVGALIAYVLQVRALNKAVTAAGATLDKFGNAFMGAGSSIKMMASSISGTAGSITAFFNSLTKENNAKRFRDIAIGIGLIAGSLALLSVVATYNADGLTNAVVLLGLIASGLIGVTFAISQISNSINPAGVAAIGLALLEFGAILLEVSAILGVITIVTSHFIKTSATAYDAFFKMFSPVVVLTSLFVALVGVLEIIAGLSGSMTIAALTLIKLGAGFAAFGGGLIALNIAISMSIGLFKIIAAQFTLFGAQLVAAFTALMNLPKEAKIAAIASLIAGLVVAIGGLVAVVAFGKAITDALSDMTLKMALSIGTLAVSLLVLSMAIVKLGKFSGDVLPDLVMLCGGLMGLYTVLQILSNSKLSTGVENLKTIGSAILKFSIGVLAVVGAIALLGKIDPEQFTQGLLGVMATIAIFTHALRLLDKVDVGKIAGAILALVAATYLLVPILALFGVAWRPIAIGIGLVAGMMLALAKSVQMMDKANPKAVIPIVSTMIVALLAMNYICQELAAMPIEKSAAVTAELVAMLLSLGIAGRLIGSVFTSISKANGNKGSLKVIGNISAMVVTMAAMAGAIYVCGQVANELANHPWEQAAAGAGGVAAMAIGLGTAVQIIGKSLSKFASVKVGAGTILKTITVMVALSGSVALLGQVASALAVQPWDQALAASASMALMAVGLGLAINLIAPAVKKMTGMDILGFVASVVSLGVAVSMLGLVATNLAAIPADQLLGVTLSLLASMGTLAVCVGILATVSQAANAINLLSMSVMIVAFAGSLTILSLALGQLDLKSALNIILVMGVFTACIAALTAVISIFSAGLLVAAPAIAAVGGAFLAFAAVVGAVALAQLAFAAAIAIVTTALGEFLPKVQSFIAFLAEMTQYSNSFNALAGPLAKVGAALIPLGLGLAAIGVGGLAAGAGLTAFGQGLTIAAAGLMAISAGFNAFKESFAVVADLAKEATTWGGDLAHNLASGLSSGIPKVGAAAYSVAREIWSYLHQTTAEKGPLAFTDIWGGHLDLNIAKDMIANKDLVGNAAELVGGTLKDSFVTSVTGAGDAGATNILTELSSYSGEFKNSGGILGQMFNSGFANTVKGFLSSIGGKLDGAITWFTGKSFNGKKNAATAAKAAKDLSTANALSEKFAKKKSNAKKTDITGDMDIVNPNDFLGSIQQLTDGNDDLAKSFGGVGDAAGKAGKGVGGAGDASKKAAQSQKELADFMKYSSQVIGEYAQTYGGAMGLVANVSPMLAAQGAFGELCEEIYQESKDASDSTQDATDDAAENAQDRIAEVQKAFVQAFTKIKEQVSSGMDFFTKFDSKVSEAMTPDEILRNADSQVQGYSRFYTRVMNLGLKGFNKQVVQSILDEGVAAYPKVAGMLKMTADQVEKLNTAFANKEAYATQAATMGMMARMNVILINKLKARLNAEKDVDVEILKEAQAYHDLQASGTASAEDIQNQFNKLTKTCTNHGTTLDAVIKKLQNSHKQVNQEILTAMSNYTELKISGTASAEEIDEAFQVLNQTCIAHGTTVEEATLSVQKYGAVSAEAIQGAIDKMQHAFTVMSEFEDYAEMIGDSVSAAMERAFDPFGEWPDEFELTGEQLMERVQKSFAGMQTYAAQLTRVGISGGQDLIAYFGDKFTPEIANAFSQLSDGQIAQINSMVMSMKNLVQTAGVSASQQWMAQGKLDGMTYQQAFAEYTSQAAFLNTAVQNMGLQFSTAIQPVMTESATQSVNTYITAMSEGFDANAEVVQEDGMKNAALLTDAMATGINDQSGIVMNSGSALSHAVDSAVRNVLSPAAGHSIGSNWVGGIINGIRSRIAEARAAAAELASAISAATAGGLDEHSPSKLSYKFGRFWDEGLVNGMDSGIGIIERSTSSVANTVVDNMREALTTARDILSDDVSTSPVITPVIDLSDAQNGISNLGSMLNANNFKINANLGRITTNADRFNALQASLQTGNAGNGVNINFEQNNYSPTELSRLDIYRQTRNQLAMLKGMVDGI